MAASAASGRMFHRILLAARTFATTSGRRVSGIQNFSQFPVFKQGLLAKVVIPTQVFFHRELASHVSGDYEKLWAAATGGRGTGRGRKKKRVRGVEPEQLKYGKAGLKWEGFNTPVLLEDGSEAGERRKREDEDGRKERFGKKWHQRGWSGTSWPGRKVGHPESPDKEVLDNFDSVVIELRRVSNMTSGGRKRTQRALVVVGNKNGVAGFGVGKGTTAMSAIRKARNKAVNYLYFVERCDGHTIYHNFETCFKKTKIFFERKPPGFGLRCQRGIKEISELLGIKDMRCKVLGPSTPLSLVRAVFQGLTSQETHQELAERTGLNVVEFRQERGMLPVVVASPSEESRGKMYKTQAKRKDYDLKQIFDPYKGLHRPKSRAQLF